MSRAASARCIMRLDWARVTEKDGSMAYYETFHSLCEGPSLGIRSHDLTDDGLRLAPGQRCRLIQGDNEIILDRTLLDCIKQHMDEESPSGGGGWPWLGDIRQRWARLTAP